MKALEVTIERSNVAVDEQAVCKDRDPSGKLRIGEPGILVVCCTGFERPSHYRRW